MKEKYSIKIPHFKLESVQVDYDTHIIQKKKMRLYLYVYILT